MKKNYYLIILLFLLSKAAFAQDDPLIGEIRIFPTTRNVAPIGWLICNGSILRIVDYANLYSVIGTTYGGDGNTTFALPDLRGRIPVGQGQGGGLSPRTLGELYGQETVTLLTKNMPSHAHQTNIKAASSKPQTNAPVTASNLATSGFNSGRITIPNVSYTTDTANLVSNSALVKTYPVGQSEPISIIKPMYVITYMIATEGMIPVPAN